MAHPDLDALLNALLPFAQQMLVQYGEFYPFGASMAVDGKIASVGGYDGNEHPPSQRIIDLLTEAFANGARAKKLRAAGICCDVLTIPPGQSEKSDAICCSLEHEIGQSVDVYLPYKKVKTGEITYGQIFAGRREPKFFVA